MFLLPLSVAYNMVCLVEIVFNIFVVPAVPQVCSWPFLLFSSGMLPALVWAFSAYYRCRKVFCYNGLDFSGKYMECKCTKQEIRTQEILSALHSYSNTTCLYESQLKTVQYNYRFANLNVQSEGLVLTLTTRPKSPKGSFHFFFPGSFHFVMLLWSSCISASSSINERLNSQPGNSSIVKSCVQEIHAWY